MLKKPLTLFSYFIYVAMYLKFQYPAAEHIGYVDNYIILYKIVSTVCLLLLGLMYVVLIGAGKQDKIHVNVEDEEKFKEALKKMNGELFKVRYSVSQFLSILGCLFSFIVLSDYYLGILFGSGVLLVIGLKGKIKELVEKAKKQVGI